eukprot:TRINITY_DN3763_c0_g1_i10.p1 TRINITY_DN3763_c0_g1~~TRINITY_DN3763_c0_g1_i10.p1  ORF type:complete len:468 (+),score=27.45 TRINITY_DN3763_c0_g1_i10:65-1468(+)
MDQIVNDYKEDGDKYRDSTRNETYGNQIYHFSLTSCFRYQIGNVVLIFILYGVSRFSITYNSDGPGWSNNYADVFIRFGIIIPITGAMYMYIHQTDVGSSTRIVLWITKSYTACAIIYIFSIFAVWDRLFAFEYQVLQEMPTIFHLQWQEPFFYLEAIWMLRSSSKANKFVALFLNFTVISAYVFFYEPYRGNPLRGLQDIFIFYVPVWALLYVANRTSRKMEENLSNFEKERKMGLNYLDHQLSSTQESILSVLPKHIFEHLMAGSTLKQKNIHSSVVVFLRVINLESLTQSLTVNKAKLLVEDLLEEISSLCRSHHGTPVKVFGNEVLILFRQYEGLSNDEVVLRKALGFSIDLQARFQRIRIQQVDSVSLQSSLSIGECIAGFASHSRLAYDLWGDAVKLARRGLDFAEPATIVIDDYTRRRLLLLPYLPYDTEESHNGYHTVIPSNNIQKLYSSHINWIDVVD